MKFANVLKKYCLLPFWIIFSRNTFADLILINGRFIVYICWVIVYFALALTVVIAISANIYKNSQLPLIVAQLPEFTITQDNEFTLADNPNAANMSSYFTDDQGIEYVVVLNEEQEPVILFNPYNANVLHEHNPAAVDNENAVYAIVFSKYINFYHGSESMKVDLSSFNFPKDTVITQDDIAFNLNILITFYLPFAVFIGLVIALGAIYLNMLLFLLIAAVIIDSIIMKHIVFSPYQLRAAVYATTAPFFLSALGVLFLFLGNEEIAKALNNSYIWAIGIIYLIFGFKDLHPKFYFIAGLLTNPIKLGGICYKRILPEDFIFMNDEERDKFYDTKTLPKSYLTRRQFYDVDNAFLTINAQVSYATQQGLSSQEEKALQLATPSFEEVVPKKFIDLAAENLKLIEADRQKLKEDYEEIWGMTEARRFCEERQVRLKAQQNNAENSDSKNDSNSSNTADASTKQQDSSKNDNNNNSNKE